MLEGSGFVVWLVGCGVIKRGSFRHKRSSFDKKIGDSYGSRTHVTGVRGQCLNRLTNEPQAELLYMTRKILSIKKFVWIFKARSKQFFVKMLKNQLKLKSLL